jgi:predicted MPP superfamily phosphohydrolase
MRRSVLNPPRPILTESLASLTWPTGESVARQVAPVVREVVVDCVPAARPETAVSPVRDRLEGAAPALPRRRALFHPRRGWLRRVERWVSHVLARDLYPKLPWTHLPYDWQLRRSLTLSEADIDIAELPAGFEGAKLLFISDVHAGPFVSPAVLRSTFERLLAVGPDVVLLGGDLVNASIGEFDTHREAFELLQAPLGVHAVLGNHDHYSRQPERLRRVIEGAGIEVLHNRSVRLRRNDDELTLAGVDDLVLGRSDLDAALADARSPTVLLSHNPDLLFDAEQRGVALMLSGHTHGGQMRIPGMPVLVRQSRYRLDEGRYRVGQTELVVSRGIGAVALPWRVHCSPEALLIRLRRAPARKNPA